MSTATIQMQDRGVITIPKQIRDALKLSKGDMINIYIDANNDSATIQPVTTIDRDILAASREGLEDLKYGRSSGAFSSMDELEKAHNIR